MSDTIEQPRRHPDIFTAVEALEYLHLNADDHRHLLETLREKELLTGWKPGKEYLYHRSELDAAVVEGFSFLFDSARRIKRDVQPVVGPRLRLTGGNRK